MVPVVLRISIKTHVDATKYGFALRKIQETGWRGAALHPALLLNSPALLSLQPCPPRAGWRPCHYASREGVGIAGGSPRRLHGPPDAKFSEERSCIPW
jgi:hypothetical protein